MLKPPRKLTAKQNDLLILADFIEDGPLKLKMCTISPDSECGSAGCIIGHAGLLWGKENCYFSREDFGERLGLNEEQVDDHCFFLKDKFGYIVSFTDVTKPMAAATLRRFALYNQTYFEVEK